MRITINILAVPGCREECMNKYKYLIIGGGMSGDMAVRGIREIDETGSIGMLTLEPYAPYDRPPLSKGLWSGDQELDDLDRETAELQVDIFVETEVTHLDRNAKSVRTAAGETFQYEKLLLATGGTPRYLPQSPEGVIYFRTRKDFEGLRAATGKPRSIGIIGGGYIGSELAASLCDAGHTISMVFPEPTMLGNILPKEIGEYLNQEFSRRGVKLLANQFVSRIEKVEDRYFINTVNGLSVEVDIVIAGLGIIPNTALAEAAGLEVSNGIHVDEFLRTSDRNIYAAGDVANIFCEPLGTRRRVEHEQAANRTGKYAGMAMAGEAKSIAKFLPMFYSDAFNISWEGVGETSNDLEVIQKWDEPFQKGEIYYVQNGETRGAIMWNKWGKLKEIRRMIREKERP